MREEGPGPIPAGAQAPIGVLLADDQSLVRAGLAMILEVEPQLSVLGEAADGAEAVRLARRTRPDVVLMDLRMPGVDGIEATRQIVADPSLSATRVLVLTTYDSDEHVFTALRAGASGFLLKDCGPDELLHGVRVVAAGDALLAPRVTARLIARFAPAHGAGREARARLAILTEREREVLALVGQGLNNAEIAAQLSLSPATARTHVGRMLTKLGARDRVQLVVLAHRSGLVD